MSELELVVDDDCAWMPLAARRAFVATASLERRDTHRRRRGYPWRADRVAIAHVAARAAARARGGACS